MQQPLPDSAELHRVLPTHNDQPSHSDEQAQSQQEHQISEDDEQESESSQLMFLIKHQLQFVQDESRDHDSWLTNCSHHRHKALQILQTYEKGNHEQLQKQLQLQGELVRRWQDYDEFRQRALDEDRTRLQRLIELYEKSHKQEQKQQQAVYSYKQEIQQWETEGEKLCNERQEQFQIKYQPILDHVNEMEALRDQQSQPPLENPILQQTIEQLLKQDLEAYSQIRQVQDKSWQQQGCSSFSLTSTRLQQITNWREHWNQCTDRTFLRWNDKYQEWLQGYKQMNSQQRHEEYEQWRRGRKRAREQREVEERLIKKFYTRKCEQEIENYQQCLQRCETEKQNSEFWKQNSEKWMQISVKWMQISGKWMQCCTTGKQPREIEKQLGETVKQLGETEKQLGETVKQLGGIVKQPREIEKQLGETEKQPREMEKQLSETETQCCDTEKQLSDTDTQLSEAETQYYETEKQYYETEKQYEYRETEKLLSKTEKQRREPEQQRRLKTSTRWRSQARKIWKRTKNSATKIPAAIKSRLSSLSSSLQAPGYYEEKKSPFGSDFSSIAIARMNANTMALVLGT